MSLSDKIFKNKSIIEGDGYFFLSVIDVKKSIKELKEDSAQLKFKCSCGETEDGYIITKSKLKKLFGDKLI